MQYQFFRSESKSILTASSVGSVYVFAAVRPVSSRLTARPSATHRTDHSPGLSGRQHVYIISDCITLANIRIKQNLSLIVEQLSKQFFVAIISTKLLPILVAKGRHEWKGREL